LKTAEIKTCLLVTDDPDDHQTFTEAIGKVSESSIVMIIVDSQKAEKLMASGTHIPDYLIIDLSMNGLEINAFLEGLRKDMRLKTIPVLTYGEPSEYADIDDRTSLSFFAKEYEYSQLQNVLDGFINNLLQ
jgi:ActR/RegA family two-component response regulator